MNHIFLCVQGRIFDSSVELQLRRGAYMQFRWNLGNLDALSNYKKQNFEILNIDHTLSVLSIKQKI